jgi:arylsulfatase A-like enzyme
MTRTPKTDPSDESGGRYEDDRPGDRPNVVLITAHDLGQFLGCYGVESVQTPALDSLADRGVQFENAYATTPVCSPARGSLLTGRYPQSNGLMGLTHPPWNWRLGDREQALPALLGEAGYETHLVGLQHVASNPSRLGFLHHHSENAVATETTAAAERTFANAGDDRPFYVQVGFSEVHRPFERGTYDEDGIAVPRYLEGTPETVTDVAQFQAAVNYLDERVGEVLGALDDHGHRDDTVVVFAADHGIPYPGAKWSCRLAGLRTALLMDGPGPEFSGRETVDGVASAVDVVPTILKALGLPVPDDVEGTSFRDYLTGDAAEPPRDSAFAQYTEDMKRDNESRCVVTEDSHLIRYFDQGRTVDYPVAVDPEAFAAHERRMPTGGARPFAQLFDVQSDPAELADLAGQDGREREVADLTDRLVQWMSTVEDPLLDGPVRVPYYERAMEDALADARDE